MSTLPDSILATAGPAVAPRAPRTVAVIDIGTVAIRMAIAEIFADGQVRKLETLSQAVPLGRDTFTRGVIGRSTIEDCVRVLASYRQLLDEYQISGSDQIRVVATSAVREAENRLAFLDRIYIATGLQVELTEEAEVSHITYLGIRPFLKKESALAQASVLVAEVGGGNTEVLVLKGDDVAYSHNYKLGSLRIRETLEAYRAPAAQLRKIMEGQIQRNVGLIAQHVAGHENLEMVALGGDVRFAARELLQELDHERLACLRLRDLEQFTDGVLEMSVDELVHRHHLAFPDAETLGPALLAYVQLARALRLSHLFVADVNLRDGLLMEMTATSRFTEQSVRPVIQSAIELGRKYHFEEAHALHVAELAKKLFQQLQAEHQLDQRYEVILYLAAILHEIGAYVNTVSHHKHTMYLITNSELFGLRARDLLLVGLVARYHRRGSPKPTHERYSSLDRDQRIVVSKLAAILRVADALDRSHSQRIHDFCCQKDDSRLIVYVPHVDDLSLEQLALMEKGPLFEETFGMPVLLRKVGA